MHDYYTYLSGGYIKIIVVPKTSNNCGQVGCGFIQERILIMLIKYNLNYLNLLQDEDRKRGGLTLNRYQELFAQFLGDQKDGNPSMYLFGPLELTINHLYPC